MFEIRILETAIQLQIGEQDINTNGNEHSY